MDLRDHELEQKTKRVRYLGWLVGLSVMANIVLGVWLVSELTEEENPPPCDVVIELLAAVDRQEGEPEPSTARTVLATWAALCEELELE